MPVHNSLGRESGRQCEALTCISLITVFVTVWLPALQRLRLRAAAGGHTPSTAGAAGTLVLSLLLAAAGLIAVVGAVGVVLNANTDWDDVDLSI